VILSTSHVVARRAGVPGTGNAVYGSNWTEGSNRSLSASKARLMAIAMRKGTMLQVSRDRL
jgi:hypothetical protein